MTTETTDHSGITPEFSSTDIELMTAVETETHKRNAVSRDPHSGYGRFTVPYTDDVQRVINEYSAGTLICNARDLLMARRRLFRAVKALTGGAR